MSLIQKRAIILLLCVVIGVTFSRAVNHGFVLLDDDIHVYQNSHLKQSEPLRELFFWKAPFQGFYIPISYTVWSLENRIAQKTDPKSPSVRVFHLTNLLLHMANAILVLLILMELGTGVWPAAAGALLFAVHPIQVEAVSWVSGLKDLLAAFFGFSAILICLRAPGKLTLARWLSATVVFLLALFSKPSAASIPLMLLVINIGLRRRQNMKSLRESLSTFVPWCLMVLPIIFITRVAQAPGQIKLFTPLWSRPLVAIDALVFYLSKLFVPFRLCPDYGRTPEFMLRQPTVYISWLALVLLFALFRRDYRAKSLLVLFAAGILPVLGFVPFLFQYFSTVADRYVYLSMLAPAIGLAWALDIAPRRRLKVLTTMTLAMLALLSYRQVEYWKDSQTLFEHTLASNPESLLAHNNLGALFDEKGKDVEAAYHYLEALRFHPDAVAADFNVGRIFARRGKYNEAASHFAKVVAAFPGAAEPHYYLGLVYSNRGNLDLARDEYLKALHINPVMPGAHRELGIVLGLEGKMPDAVFELKRALSLDPKQAKALFALGDCLQEQGKIAEAIPQYEAALKLAPDLKVAREKLESARRQMAED